MPIGLQFRNAGRYNDPVMLGQTTTLGLGCGYVDPNPL